MKSSDIQLGKYIHYKTKKLYEVIGIARHSETLEEMVIYKALYHCDAFGTQAIWVRPKKMFFEKICYQNQISPRFSYVGDK